ncbi:MAG TPA: hypothetical protein VHM88_06770 [Candidatus Acidoferrales bacterium]|jgi:hypothetical protein|nr:hypothetical protein [Candidatus Acidoferrales bacterium]
MVFRKALWQWLMLKPLAATISRSDNALPKFSAMYVNSFFNLRPLSPPVADGALRRASEL